MKIGVISAQVFQCPPSGYSGLEMIAWQIAKGLAAKGHQVALIAPDGSTCPGAEIINSGPPGQWDERTAYSKYWQVLPNFDVIVDHSWGKWAYVLKQEGRLPQPVLGVCHAPVDTMFKSPPPVDKPCFVCISQDQANHLQALHSVAARVAYNGVDLNFYKPMGIARSKRFLFLARFSTIKGPLMAIQACKEAGVGLDLVGDTSITNEPDYFKQCSSLADGEQIRIIGPATRGECVWWFSQAHCLLHPNKLFREPFGLAPVEAMACGCPVIAWDNGAMRETLGTLAGNALVKSFGDLVWATKQAATLKEYMEINRSAVREQASKFSEENMVMRYEELCKEAIEGGGW